MSNSITPPDQDPTSDDQSATPQGQGESAIPHDQDPTPSDQEQKEQPAPPEPEPIRWPKTVKPIEPKNSKQLAGDLGVSLRVFRQYYKAIKAKVGERVGHMFSRKQVFMFYDHYGYPHGYFND
ncbi:MAG: hypothetical protein QM762_03135 [Chryseolinea sp.]